MQNLHPLFVHLPIGLFLIVPILDLAGLIRRNAGYHRAAWLVLLIGVIAAAFAVMTGLRAESTVAHPIDAAPLIAAHKFWSLTLLGLSVAALLLRPSLTATRRRWIVFALVQLIVLWSTVFATGSIGGRIVYDYGVGTAVYDTVPVADSLTSDSTHFDISPNSQLTK